ncbi:MAG TPA: ribonuclease III [Caulobacteraceae bacterium]|nr:ribonuclease III [Caulobacteraceae bacterium]
MSSRAAAIAALERRLGFAFKDRALLERALTHASKLGLGRGGVLHNERLEFLGDRVLGLVVAEALFQRDVDAGPEILAKRYAHLVSREVCAAVAEAIGLADAMDVPRAQGLRRNETVLADGCEALLGAAYLDQGFEAAKAVALDLWATALEQPLDLEAANPKTTLQEWALARRKPLPKYSIVSREGPDHAPVFRIEVTVDGLAPATGEGRSRQAAEKRAAEAFLQREAGQ